MKSWIINLVGKVTGISAIWKGMDGYKTKTSGVIMLLTGLAGILSGLIACTDAASLLAFSQALMTSPSVILFLNGLGILGIGHKAEKLQAISDKKIDEEKVPTVV